MINNPLDQTTPTPTLSQVTNNSQQNRLALAETLDAANAGQRPIPPHVLAAAPELLRRSTENINDIMNARNNAEVARETTNHNYALLLDQVIGLLRDTCEEAAQPRQQNIPQSKRAKPAYKIPTAKDADAFDGSSLTQKGSTALKTITNYLNHIDSFSDIYNLRYSENTPTTFDYHVTVAKFFAGELTGEA
jgi:hypothetical protein